MCRITCICGNRTVWNGIWSDVSVKNFLRRKLPTPMLNIIFPPQSRISVFWTLFCEIFAGFWYEMRSNLERKFILLKSDWTSVGHELMNLQLNALGNKKRMCLVSCNGHCWEAVKHTKSRFSQYIRTNCWTLNYWRMNSKEHYNENCFKKWKLNLLMLECKFRWRTFCFYFGSVCSWIYSTLALYGREIKRHLQNVGVILFINLRLIKRTASSLKAFGGCGMNLAWKS